jgi:hypothetical protein
MSKKSLLALTQSVLSGIDADEVNSISDTYESEQVANIIRESYEDIIGRRFWPHLKRLVAFENSNDIQRPTHLRLADRIQRMVFVKYDTAELGETRRKYRDIKYQTPDEFLRNTNQRNNDNENINVITDFSGIELLIRNDYPPKYYTSFDDDYLVFDSWDWDTEDTIQSTRVQAQAYVAPIWQHTDEYIPDLHADGFALLLSEAKSQASIELKQMVNEKAEVRARKHDAWNSQNAFRVNGGVTFASYGRKGGRGRFKKHPLDKTTSITVE